RLAAGSLRTRKRCLNSQAGASGRILGCWIARQTTILQMLAPLIRTALVLLVLILSGCSEHRVDSFTKWCEHLAGVDLHKKYAPSWSVFPSVSYHGDAIRDSYVDFLNKTHLEKIENRAPKMAWREGAQLHLIILSS